jgi:hypothetical protein|tara:strand:+ start:181 stop:414 length:234 start_codon:yes stop_codon:yes gene_type:complete
MTNSKEKYITINVNEEIKNLCPDLEEEQVITLSEIIDNEFNMEVVYNELERHIVGYLDDIGQGFKIIEEELEEELEE